MGDRELDGWWASSHPIDGQLWGFQTIRWGDSDSKGLSFNLSAYLSPAIAKLMDENTASLHTFQLLVYDLVY